MAVELAGYGGGGVGPRSPGGGGGVGPRSPGIMGWGWSWAAVTGCGVSVELADPHCGTLARAIGWGIGSGRANLMGSRW